MEGGQIIPQRRGGLIGAGQHRHPVIPTQKAVQIFLQKLQIAAPGGKRYGVEADKLTEPNFRQRAGKVFQYGAGPPLHRRQHLGKFHGKGVAALEQNSFLQKLGHILVVLPHGGFGGFFHRDHFAENQPCVRQIVQQGCRLRIDQRQKFVDVV